MDDDGCQPFTKERFAYTGMQDDPEHGWLL